MEIRSYTNNWNRVITKEELLELLKKSSVILNKSIEEYLTSLIELEFSVIRDYISDEERDALKELEIYQKVAIYNIYNRAVELFRSNAIPTDIADNNESLNICYPYFNMNIKLFNFDYSKHLNLGENIPDGYESRKIGSIILFKTLEDKELREKELDSIMLKLEELYDAKNPYPNIKKKIGGPHSFWTHEHNQKIKEYEKLFTELDSKKELTLEEEKEIEITNEVYNLLLEDYGLSIDSFNEMKLTPMFSFNHQSKMKKTLVKKLPNLSIYTNIKYI